MAKLGLFDAKMPRYTSYPSVQHFGPQIGATDFQSWIGQIRPGSQVSLYLHVPFCRQLCWFCMCRTQGTRSDAPISAYVTALKQEIARLTLHLPPGVTLGRMHWGGGTPTILSPAMIRELSAALAAALPLSRDAEFSVEIDPNEFDKARCTALIEAGMTRASIGVQGFDDMTQQAIGRKLGFDRVAQVVAMLRAGGVQQLSTDLLFGLPHQSLDQIRQSCRQLLSLTPDRLALYGYKHLPAQIRRQAMIPSETLAKPEERLQLFKAASALCLDAGYQAVGIGNFARPGDALVRARDTQSLKRGFQGYSDDPAEVLIGVGASAISCFPQGYVQNAPSTARYMASLAQGEFGSARGHALTAEDRLRAAIIESLLTGFAIPCAQILSLVPDMQVPLRSLIDEACAKFPDLLLPTPQGARVADHARLLTRVIARHFDTYDTAPPQALAPAARHIANSQSTA